MVLSLDMGSSSTRAIVFSDDGLPVPGRASVRPHALQGTPDGGSEADADQLFELLVQCIDEALEKPAPPIEAVALATFWHSMLPVGRDGRALGPVTTWADTRGAAQARQLAALLDEERTRARTGTVFHPSYFPARLLRICQTDRRLFDETDWWCSIGEYCQLRLFGTRRCSVSMASGTGLFDQDQYRWDPELLEHLLVPALRLSPIDDSPFLGLVSPFRERWPGLKDIPWFPALGDGHAATSGAGARCRGARPS